VPGANAVVDKAIEYSFSVAVTALRAGADAAEELAVLVLVVPPVAGGLLAPLLQPASSAAAPTRRAAVIVRAMRVITDLHMIGRFAPSGRWPKRTMQPFHPR